MEKEKTSDVIINCLYECITPLSHIGETHSIGSFFNTEEFLSSNGEWVHIPTYTGNAIRGMLRRETRNHLVKMLDIKLNEEWFGRLSFGAGASETTMIDVQKRTIERKLMPGLSIFGYGLGSMPGKLSPSPLRLVCIETEYLIPQKYIPDALFEAAEHIGNQSFIRLDDFKNDVTVNDMLNKESINIDEKTGKRQISSGESTTQMRYEVEMLKTGSKLYGVFQLRKVTDVEIGCFLTALKEWGKYSELGGMHNKGYGKVKATFDFINQTDDVRIDNFFVVNQDVLGISEKAEEYIQKYDTFLKETIIPIMEKYTGFLEDSKFDIVKMLNGEANGTPKTKNNK